MGYYSQFEVKVIPDPGVFFHNDFMANELNEASGGYHFEPYGRDIFLAEGKWYDWERDMTEYSKNRAELLIEVAQTGEDGEGNKIRLRAGEVLRRWKKGWEEV